MNVILNKLDELLVDFESLVNEYQRFIKDVREMRELQKTKSGFSSEVRMAEKAVDEFIEGRME